MKRGFGLVLGIAMLVTPVRGHCNVLPRPGAGDPHIQSVLYDPEQVISISAVLGYQIVVKFPPDEQIESVAIGDAPGWQVNVGRRQQALFVKPTSVATSTNMTVIGANRVYAFDLAAQDTLLPTSPYVITVELTQSGQVQAPVTKAVAHYDLKGDRNLFPERIFDDGRFTYIVWPQTTDLPAVFRQGARGEALVNGAMHNNVFTVEEVADQLVFRAGSAVATATRRLTVAADKPHE